MIVDDDTDVDDHGGDGDYGNGNDDGDTLISFALPDCNLLENKKNKHQTTDCEYVTIKTSPLALARSSVKFTMRARTWALSSARLAGPF